MDIVEACECAKPVGAAHSIPYHMIPANPNRNFDPKAAEEFKAEGRVVLMPGEELKPDKF